MLRYLAIRIKAIRAEIRFGSRSAYWSLKFEAYCPRAKLEAKPKLDTIAQIIADFLFARAPSFSSLDAETYHAQITIIMTAPICMPFGRFPLRLENIKEKTGYPPTIGATNFIGPFIKALYKDIPASAKNDPDATETDRARIDMWEKSAFKSATGL